MTHATLDAQLVKQACEAAIGHYGYQAARSSDGKYENLIQTANDIQALAHAASSSSLKEHRWITIYLTDFNVIAPFYKAK